MIRKLVTIDSRDRIDPIVVFSGFKIIVKEFDFSVNEIIGHIDEFEIEIKQSDKQMICYASCYVNDESKECTMIHELKVFNQDDVPLNVVMKSNGYTPLFNIFNAFIPPSETKLDDQSIHIDVYSMKASNE